MIKQIINLNSSLNAYGFSTEIDNDKIVIIKVLANHIEKIVGNEPPIMSDLDLSKIRHVFEIFIAFDEPDSTNYQYIWQGCKLNYKLHVPAAKAQVIEIWELIGIILKELNFFEGI